MLHGQFSVCVANPPAGLPYETDGDARRLA